MSLEELLEELKKEYLATFPAKIQLIGELFEKKAYTELETEFHKLKGTGRTHGVPEVTQLGELVERLCEIDRSSLPHAVPRSLVILAKIRDCRNRGEAYDIEKDPDFLLIVRLVMTAGLTPKPPGKKLSRPSKPKPRG